VSNDDAPASITVVKVIVPDDAADPDDFALTLTPEGGDAIDVLSSIGNAVPANETYTVGETQVDGFVQLSLECEDSEGAVDHPVELVLGQDVTCTITNAESPTVTVIKNTDPQTSQTFEFTLDDGDFSDSQDVPGDGTPFTWEDLDPGSFDLSEALPEGWEFDGAECDLGFGEIANGVNFDLEYGDHITCVFGNNELGSITVIKVTDVTSDEEFDIDPGGDGSDSLALENGESFTWSLMQPGEYSLTEVLAAAQATQWAASVVCDAEYSTTPAPGSLAAEFALNYGQDITCTFTNTAQPSDLAVTKIDLVDPVTVDTDNPTATITYEIVVTNNGPARAENVVATDTLPATVTFVSATPEVGSCAHAAGIVTCDLGDMEPGASVTIFIVVETEAAGEVTVPTVLNVVEVVSDTDDNNPDNNQDDEETSIIEILDVVILPFTGVDSDYLFAVGLGLALGGMAMIWATRRREDEVGLDH
jgi:uncharacterized repeat protein (TIGR01451 family)